MARGDGTLPESRGGATTPHPGTPGAAPGALARTGSEGIWSGGDGPRRYLRIIAAETPSPEPFYVLPKRLAVLDLRVADGAGATVGVGDGGSRGGGVGGWGGRGGGARPAGGDPLGEWEARLRSAIGQVSQPAGPPPDAQAEHRSQADANAAGNRTGRLRGSGRGWTLILALAVLNACLMLARIGSEAAFALSLLAANLLVCYALSGGGRPPPPPLPPLPPPHVDRKLSRSERPRAGMACGDSAVLSAPLARNGDGREFRVRCGPDYPRLGGKAPSAPAMYELLSSDFGRAPHSIRHVAERMTLPSPPCVVQGRLPPLLVLSVVVPVPAPALLGESPDEECVVAVFCFGATDGAQAASREAVPPPAVELMARFNAEAAEKRMDAGVFKVGCLVASALQGMEGGQGMHCSTGCCTSHHRPTSTPPPDLHAADAAPARPPHPEAHAHLALKHTPSGDELGGVLAHTFPPPSGSRLSPWRTIGTS